MSRLVECPQCSGFGLIDVDIPQGNLPRSTSSSVTCPRCDGLEVVDADESGRPLDDWPARDMGGRLPVAGDFQEPRR